MEFLVAIDRIEGDTAVLLPAGEAVGRPGPGATLLWPKALLPDGAVEGAYLRVAVAVDPQAAAEAGVKVRGLLDRLRSGPGPDSRKGGGAGR
ncbi:MAG: DUF3006 domain-containing protein [Bacillota bacterium]|nr:MAG: DUF3006 domain-containing protein [Bacillota bacterium]